MAYLLGIDIGTSGTKCALYNERGEALASSTKEYPLYQPQNGWAEQRPEDWWDAVCNGTREVLSKSGVAAAEISGIGLSGQMHGLVMLDADGKVLRPAILWCDQRTGEECADITARVGAQRLIELTANPALTGFTASKILWVRKHDPASYSACRHILLPKDYIRFMLTGELATEVSDASGMQLLDVTKRAWSDEVLTKLDIDKSLLAKVYESPEITGKITASASEATGLAVGTAVVGGAGDNAAAAVGTGVVRDGTAFTTIGSSGVVYAHTSQISIDPAGRVHTFCCAVPGAWHVMGVTQGAGLSLKWFREQLCGDITADAEAKGVSPYMLMDKLAGAEKPGSDGLIYLPYLMGERTPHLDPDCRGVFFGLSGAHTRAHMIRAVMEGVGCSLRDCLDVLIGMGASVASMRACGGGASPLWRQMLSDIYNLPVQTLKNNEGPALGVALLAGVGAGVYKSVPEAVDAAIGVAQECKPDAHTAEAYVNVHNLYKKLYVTLKPLYKELRVLR